MHEELSIWQRRCRMDMRGQGQYAISTLVALAPMTLVPFAVEAWVLVSDVSSNWTNYLHVGAGVGVAMPRTAGSVFAGWETTAAKYQRWSNFREEENWAPSR